MYVPIFQRFRNSRPDLTWTPTWPSTQSRLRCAYNIYLQLVVQTLQHWRNYTSFFLSLTLDPKSPPPPIALFSWYKMITATFLESTWMSPSHLRPLQLRVLEILLLNLVRFTVEISDPSPGIKRTKHNDIIAQSTMEQNFHKLRVPTRKINRT